MDNDGELVSFEIDASTLDCADVFATLIQREHPDVETKMGLVTAAPWRPIWTITIPKQSNLSVKELNETCHTIQMRMFWEAGTLIGYAVQREQDNEPSE